MKRNHSLYQSTLSLLLKRHRTAILMGLGRLKKHLSSTIFTSLVIAMTLALPILLLVLVNNVDYATKGLTASAKISVYLKPGTSEQTIQDLMHELSAQEQIIKIRYISPEQGLSEFAKSVGFKQVLLGLNHNPLPAVLEISPSIAYQQPAQLQILAAQLRQLPAVDDVQLDMDWIKRLFAILSVIKSVTLGIAIILGFGTVIIVGNTIKYAIQHYQKEIQVLKLIGASDSLIRRPFLYTGVFYGLFGTLLAMFIVGVFTVSLSRVVNNLADTFSTKFQLHLFGFSSFVAFCLLGIALGLLGAWITVSRSIKQC